MNRPYIRKLVNKNEDRGFDIESWRMGLTTGIEVGTVPLRKVLRNLLDVLSNDETGYDDIMQALDLYYRTTDDEEYGISAVAERLYGVISTAEDVLEQYDNAKITNEEEK